MQSFTSLVQQFEQRLSAALPFPDLPENLYEPCRYLIGLGGKRIRPTLCLMGNELFGDLQEDAWKAALGVELFHNFTLIHDDIMDKAPLRRGHPTVHERNGLTAGILCGDVMNIFAYQQFAQITHQLGPVLQLFNETAIEVCEGQQLDMDYEARLDVTIDEYLNMIDLKTSVLLAASLKMGAIIGGAMVGSADKLYAFGKNLGLAFQLQDDFLDAFGDAEKLGKQNGGDIKANKKTYLLIHALEAATGMQKEELNYWLNQENHPQKVSSVLALFDQTGAHEKCREVISHYSDQAFKCLEDVAVLSNRKAHLNQLAQQLLQRQY